MYISKAITNVYRNAKRICFDNSSKIVLMSDCHRGDGSETDNFMHNRNIYSVALMQYYNDDFTYIEIGDGDELWESNEFFRISGSHKNIFEILARFHEAGRLHMLYGNHDMVKKNRKWAEKNMYHYLNEMGGKEAALFPRLEIVEGVILTHIATNDSLFLLHGHQADFLNNELWRLSRFLVRYLWRPLELIGIKDPFSPTNSHSKRNAVEKHLSDWAEQEKHILVAGHTHRPLFPEIGEPLYFNDGACIFPYFITAIEITNGEIALVQWSIKAREDGFLYIGRDVLKGPRRIQDYYK